jgi:TolA-binding protein
MKMLILLFLASTLAWAQSTPAQSAPPSQGTSAGSTRAAPATPDRANSETTVPADIKEVRRNLEALKTAVGKMDDGPAHDAAEQNVKFLESLVSYLEHEKTPASGATTRPSRRAQPTQAPQGVAGENPNPR